jgi:hypothetical protein
MKSYKMFLDEIGITETTGWRWRKRGMLSPVNIYGRLYMTDDAIAEFHRRAEAGEFAKKSFVPHRRGELQ